MSELSQKIRNLINITTALGNPTSFDELCAWIVRGAKDIFQTELVGLFLKKERDRFELVEPYTFAVNDNYRQIAVGKGIVGWVAKNGKAAKIPDVHADSRYTPGVEGVNSKVTSPIVFDNHVIGILDVQSRERNTFSDEDEDLLVMYCNLVAIAMNSTVGRDNSRAKIIELKARSERHELIDKIGRTLVEGSDLKSTMKRVVDLVATNLHYTQTAVLLYDEAFDELEVISAFGYGEVDGLRIPLSQGATGYAVRNREVVVIPDVTTDPRYVKGMHQGRSELVVPILSKENILGVIDVESPFLNAFDKEDVRLLELVASYTSGAIGISKREESLKSERSRRYQRELEVKLLSAVGTVLGSAGERDSFFDEALSLLGSILGWKTAAVWTLEPESGQLVLETTVKDRGMKTGTRLKIGSSVPGIAARDNENVLDYAECLFEKGVKRSQMAAPLRDRQEMIAVLHVVGESQIFGRDELTLLTAFARQVSSALTLNRLEHDTSRQIKDLDDRTRRLDLLTRVSRSLTKRLHIDQLLEELLRLCVEAFDLSHCAVLLLDKTKPVLLRQASLGYDDEAPFELAVGEGITGHVAATGVPLLVADVTKDPRYIKGVRGSRAEMAVPLRVFGEIIGVLDAESVEEWAFTEEDLDLFTCFAAQAAVAIHNANLLEKLEASRENI